MTTLFVGAGMRTSHPSSRRAVALQRAEGELCLTCDADQAKQVLHDYRNLRLWYEAEHADSVNPGDIGHWEVDYEQYVDFVEEVAGAMELRPGDAVYESAVGPGWLLRGLREVLPLNTSNTLRLAGNDIMPTAIESAIRELESSTAPTPVLCLGDSANLSWVPSAAFDAGEKKAPSYSFTPSHPPFLSGLMRAPSHSLPPSLPPFLPVLCGYLENKAVGAEGGNWAGNWVCQMAWCAKPGALIFIGNNHMPSSSTVLDPDANFVPTKRWWIDAAESDRFGWGVDPASVRFVPLRSGQLRKAWGERYSVFMRRDKTPSRASPLLVADNYWRDREFEALPTDSTQKMTISRASTARSQSRRVRLRRFSRNVAKLLEANGGQVLHIREEEDGDE